MSQLAGLKPPGVPGGLGGLAALAARAAGELGRAGRVDEAQVAGVGMGAVEVEAEPGHRPGRDLQLDAAGAHLVGIGEVAAQHAELAVGDGRLIVVDLRPERGEVHGQPPVEEAGLEAELEMVDRLGLDRGGAQDRLVGRVERQARQIDAAGFERPRIGRIAEHVGGKLIGQGEVAGDVPVAELRPVALRRQGGALVAHHARRRRRIADDQIAGAVGHDRVVAAGLAVVIDAQAGLERQPVGELPAELAERRHARRLEHDVVFRPQPLQHRRVAGVGGRRIAAARPNGTLPGLSSQRLAADPCSWAPVVCCRCL